MDMVKQVLIDPSPEHVCETQVKLLRLQSDFAMFLLTDMELQVIRRPEIILGRDSGSSGSDLTTTYPAKIPGGSWRPNPKHCSAGNWETTA